MFTELKLDPKLDFFDANFGVFYLQVKQVYSRQRLTLQFIDTKCNEMEAEEIEQM